MSGLVPSLSQILTSPPLSIKTCATSEFPVTEASRKSGVQFVDSSIWFTSLEIYFSNQNKIIKIYYYNETTDQSYSRSRLTISVEFESTAQCKGDDVPMKGKNE